MVCNIRSVHLRLPCVTDRGAGRMLNDEADQGSQPQLLQNLEITSVRSASGNIPPAFRHQERFMSTHSYDKTTSEASRGRPERNFLALACGGPDRSADRCHVLGRFDTEVDRSQFG